MVTPEQPTSGGGRALVVDDEPTNRLVLGALLGQMGFEVVEAEDGHQAISQFQALPPDIVFMDIMMPGMDGFEATARLKQISADHFVPIIILTAMSDRDALSRCIKVGGDDVLTKPIDFEQLKSRIHAMMRIRELHTKVARLFQHMRHDEEVAQQVFQRAVTARNVAPQGLRTLQRSASVFSGDMILSGHDPGGGLHLLLGDFTGHGLTAAIGALPSSEVFHAMLAKGFSGYDILVAINQKLYDMLPDGMFLAASYLHIDRGFNHITLFNCGLPPILITNGRDGRIRHRIGAHHFPLGLDRDFPGPEEFERMPLTEGDCMLTYTDGLTESRSPEGEEFGEDRLDSLVDTPRQGGSSFDRVVAALDRFCQDHPQHDDISLVEIPFRPEMLGEGARRGHQPQTERANHAEAREVTDSFEIALTLRGRRLGRNEAIPHIMNELQQNRLPETVVSELYTVLAELFTNALDHGVLGLDSAMKEAEDGFADYFAERERRLTALQQGHVSIAVQVCWHEEGGRVRVTVEDSGPGFGPAPGSASETVYHGRGIALVRELCQSLSYQAPGNKVEAIYTWTE